MNKFLIIFFLVFIAALSIRIESKNQEIRSMRKQITVYQEFFIADMPIYDFDAIPVKRPRAMKPKVNM